MAKNKRLRKKHRPSASELTNCLPKWDLNLGDEDAVIHKPKLKCAEVKVCIMINVMTMLYGLGYM